MKKKTITKGDIAMADTGLVHKLATAFPAARIIKHLEDLLTATVGGKEGPDGTIVGARPDCRSVESGLKLILAYLEGLPVQRVLTANATPKESDEDTLARLAASPAAMRALAATLSEMPGGREAMDSALRVTGKTMEAVEVEA